MGTKLWSKFLLAQMVFLAPLSCFAGQINSIEFDPRITKNHTFTFPTFKTAVQFPVTDASQQWHGCATGISNTPGGWNAFRAGNLAQCKHYSEAIKELTIALSHFTGVATKTHLRPDAGYYVQRATVYMQMNDHKNAVSDFQKAVEVANPHDEQIFKASLGLMQLGKFAEAEIGLNKMLEGSHWSHKPYHLYVLGIALERQSKSTEAIGTFKKAAESFALLGYANHTEACIDKVNEIMHNKPGSPNEYTLKNLPMPRTNLERQVKLVEYLATNNDCFDQTSKDFLKAYADPKRRSQTDSQIFQYDLDPKECVVLKSDVEAFLKNKKSIQSRVRWQKGYAYTEAYEVPSGILELSWHSGGFNQLRHVELFSKETEYPPVSKSVRVENKYSPYAVHDNFRLFSVSGNSKEAQKYIETFMKDEPTRYEPYVYQANLFAEKGKYEEALKAIDKAISLQPKEQTSNRLYGNKLLVAKSTYLLGLGKLEEADETFEQGSPSTLTADDLLIRGKIFIAQGRVVEARNVFRKASKEFYQQCRIVKRDEAEALLNSIGGGIKTGVSTLHKSLSDERAK